MSKITEYLNEAPNKTKALANKLDVELNNVIMKTIDDFISKNVGINGWDTPTQRSEVLLKAAQGQIQFFNGMVKSAKRDI